ncbi:hypothetical protein RND81_05G131800 [Saponaria officinalis]|uniref:Uncharacterized protein n=1 Tax=Saponaria officinalis TaxID=3572 RepID=A0AAW1L0I2_SAPOF
MAQAKPTEVVKVLNGKQAFLDELKEVDARSQKDCLTLRFFNGTDKEVHSKEIHHWRGPPFTYPSLIRPDSGVLIGICRDFPEGVKFGISYVDGPDNSARKSYIIAADTLTTQVYVKSGPACATDWNAVEVELGQSGAESKYDDPILGGKIYAHIDGNNLRATFEN